MFDGMLMKNQYYSLWSVNLSDSPHPTGRLPETGQIMSDCSVTAEG